jgi:hypothetical protein
MAKLMDEILNSNISDAEALRNVANSVIRATEKTNLAGKHHSQRYAGSKDEIAGAARQLAEMVLQALGQPNTGVERTAGTCPAGGDHVCPAGYRVSCLKCGHRR